MIRRFGLLALLTLMLAAGALSGCGKKGPLDVPPPREQSDKDKPAK